VVVSVVSLPNAVCAVGTGEPTDLSRWCGGRVRGTQTDSPTASLHGMYTWLHPHKSRLIALCWLSPQTTDV